MLHRTGQSSSAIGGEYVHESAHGPRLSIQLVDHFNSYKALMALENVPKISARGSESGISNEYKDENCEECIAIYSVGL